MSLLSESLTHVSRDHWSFHFVYTDLKKVWFNYLERKEQQKLQSNVLAANGVAKSTNNENDDDDDFEFSFKSDQR